jgi:hypothetical protein
MSDVTVVSEFDVFWHHYPRKVGKPRARSAFNVARTKVTFDRIAEGLAPWIAYWDERDEPQYVPHPTTWLNQERWNDDPPPPAHAEAPGMARIRQLMRAAQGD